jgi:IS30 family transposase
VGNWELIEERKTEIAEIIGVHKSTISREVKRSKGLQGYRLNNLSKRQRNAEKKKASLNDF